MPSRQKEEVSGTVDDLRADVDQLRADMAEMLNTLVELGRSEAGEKKEQLQKKATEQVEHLRKGAEYARQKGRWAYDNIETQIEQRPMTSVLTALGIGFAVGLITGNRK